MIYPLALNKNAANISKKVMARRHTDKISMCFNENLHIRNHSCLRYRESFWPWYKFQWSVFLMGYIYEQTIIKDRWKAIILTTDDSVHRHICFTNLQSVKTSLWNIIMFLVSGKTRCKRLWYTKFAIHISRNNILKFTLMSLCLIKWPNSFRPSDAYMRQ